MSVCVSVGVFAMLRPIIWLAAILVVHAAWNSRSNSQKTPIPIAALFHPEQKQQELAFRVAVERINMDNGVLPNAILQPRIEYFAHFDSYNTSRRVCNLTEDGVAAIFGPLAEGTHGIVQSICDTMGIPHIELRWDTSNKQPRNVVNLYPESKLLAQAVIQVIRDMDWTTFTIVYEDYEELVRLQEVLKEHDGTSREQGHPPFTVLQLPKDDEYRPMLKQIKAAGESHIILECRTDKIIRVLRQASEVKLVGEYHSFLLVTLDAHTLDYSEFPFGRTNITSLRLFDPQSQQVQAAIQDWIFSEEWFGRRLNTTPHNILTESALMYDAVHLFAKALDVIDTRNLEIGSFNCDNDAMWQHGIRIVNYMKFLRTEGLSGLMTFDEYGRRTYFSVDIIQLASNGSRKIGTWDPIHGINYTRSISQMTEEIKETITTKEFIVMSRIGRPYLDYAKGEGLTGNARYEGYSMDIIDAIAKDLGFKFRMELVPDKEYGSLNKVTKQWNGLIRELREQRADLAICDLTITHERRSAVDFTMPFMTLGISILYSKPARQPPDLFSFLSPMSLDVWIYMATAYLGVSLMLYFLSRCSPGEWENPHPCNPDPEELELTFNLPNCLWFSTGSIMAQGSDILPKLTPYEWRNPHPCNQSSEYLENNLTMNNIIWHNCGSIMQQGSDIAPQAVSTRIVAGMWWFFTLIMISSYTANLAAFLTTQKMDESIQNVDDLANQNKIKYGVLKGGSTANFFRNSNDSRYQRMWSAMQSAQPSVFVSNNDEGVERVRKGKRGYAYFMESTSIEFQMEQYCDLTKIGDLLDSKGYGIAMPFNSPYRTEISGAVLKLQESGKLRELKRKWWSWPAWKSNETSCEQYQQSDEVDSTKLGMSNVGGVFVVLISGCCVAFFVSILEFLWNVRRVAVHEKLTPWQAFVTELKFVLLCNGTTKPVRPPHSPSQSLKGSCLDLNMFTNKFTNMKISEPQSEQVIRPEWVSDLHSSVK